MSEYLRDCDSYLDRRDHVRRRSLFNMDMLFVLAMIDVT